MSNTPRNKKCWVKGCEEPQNKSEWFCDKHERMSLKGHKLELDSPTSPKSVGKPGA